jgi:hypothetical protein
MWLALLLAASNVPALPADIPAEQGEKKIAGPAFYLSMYGPPRAALVMKDGVIYRPDELYRELGVKPAGGAGPRGR